MVLKSHIAFFKSMPPSHAENLTGLCKGFKYIIYSAARMRQRKATIATDNEIFEIFETLQIA